jgi:prophage antirepressor-like protein
MTQLTKITSNIFNEVHVDFFKNEAGDIIMTAEQIGSALDYANPRQSIINLFNRNKARLEKYSVETKLISTDGKEYSTRIFTEQGIYGIIFLSNNKKAIDFQEWVYEIIRDIRKNGFYMQTTTVSQPELMSKVKELEFRLESFVTLNSYEASMLQKAIARRICEIEEDKTERSKYFRELHREIRDRFGVPSYRDVARTEFQAAINYVRNWIPRRTAA